MRLLERTPVRIAAFAVALVAVYAVALGIGTRVGPVEEPATADSTHGHDHRTGRSDPGIHPPCGPRA